MTPILPPAPCATVDAVRADLLRRAEFGLAKYGQSVADNPLPLRAWLQHAYEEALDKAVYLKRAIEEMDRQPGVSHVRCTERERIEAQRDAATAERDRLAEALKQIVAQDWWDAMGDEPDETDGKCAEIARAALASIKKDTTDGE